MNGIPISPEIWKLAAEILTQKQLVVLTLREKHGFSWNQLAVHFNCTKATVREHHRAAAKNIFDELERRRMEARNGSILKEGHPPNNSQPRSDSAEPRPRSGHAARVAAPVRAPLRPGERD